ncbi:MAG: 50S ribosomal protein L4 [Tenuifilaceae bacterium]|jgi:large subunit ribosomal protein L4|nr:50S ribosomal protein L4 [Bacteroidales bacterium]MDI9515520.1 50S ribosomal protein L4 [Bacteroidota bacterium]NLH56242.1 50S ribosomal protein L4 [Rikenellaceae bacterium]OQC63609.1 MAG: 50S ribosomal protein L4 [Bacteroidetes bacterium ADurb.Bin008]HNV81123.1 50S ribosomal protein L4 [Tenuifilaceae bacterium]
MEINVLNIEGKETGRKVELKEEIFGIQPNDHAIYLDVKQYLANQRQGTHKSKERNEVSGSTRKLKRQKGTGTARSGSIKSPLFRGGGRVFGPQPRDYSFKLNKKLKQLARKSALTYKAKNNSILVLEDFNIETPKTKEIVNICQNLNLIDKKSVFVLGEPNKNIYLSSRNLQKQKVLTASSINTYEIMNANALVLVESSIDVLNKMFHIA